MLQDLSCSALQRFSTFFFFRSGVTALQVSDFTRTLFPVRTSTNVPVHRTLCANTLARTPQAPTPVSAIQASTWSPTTRAARPKVRQTKGFIKSRCTEPVCETVCLCVPRRACASGVRTVGATAARCPQRQLKSPVVCQPTGLLAGLSLGPAESLLAEPRLPEHPLDRHEKPRQQGDAHQRFSRVHKPTLSNLKEPMLNRSSCFRG